MNIFVAKTGSDSADGSSKLPFLTINRAAQAALPGDTIIVHEGEYREWVKPVRGGLSESRRITFTAAPGEKVVIKGSEHVTDWTLVSGTTWKTEVPNSLFGDFNPFAEELAGDWVVYEASRISLPHLGDVYLNGQSFFEAASTDEVLEASGWTEDTDHWTGVRVNVKNPEQTKYLWYASVGRDSTTIWANFHGADPRVELVEISVRRSVFYPSKHHLDYITVRGFELAHAATPWAPPTADQPGLIGPNWAKGWIIEDNVIHDAKCSAVSLGKEESTGHNYFTLRGDKPGYQYQLESVFSAQQIGWDREHIGSHIVRRNRIYDCGQNGIVGHLGCVFSTIEDNHIYNIATKREFYGYEIGGIKLHAALDVTIEHNLIHDCSLGTWLDWQTQGTRVTRNIYFDNNRDLFVEVSHGPYVVDSNVFGSPASIESFSQGGAYVNNLIMGTLRLEPVLDRATPYHHPHTTQVAGFGVIFGADDRFIGNLFIASEAESYALAGEGDPLYGHGTAIFDEHPESWAGYMDRVNAQEPGDHQRYWTVKQPVYIRDNGYSDGATPYAKETDPIGLGDLTATIVIEGDQVTLNMVGLPSSFSATIQPVRGGDLQPVRLAGLAFEDRSGEELLLNKDLIGKQVDQFRPLGPLADLNPSVSAYRIW